MKFFVPMLFVALFLPMGAFGQAGEEGDGASEAESSTEAAAPVGKPPPWLFLREQFAVTFWKLGVGLDVRAQFRVPLHRSPSVLFQTTYFGIGARFRASPAFVDIGPRISIAPVEIFELEVTPYYRLTWPGSSGLLPYADPTESRLYDIRGDRHDGEQGFDKDQTGARTGHTLAIEAAATLKLKVGPIIILDTFTLDAMKFILPNDWPDGGAYLYEALWDRILDTGGDIVFDNSGVVAGEILPGGEKPRLILGALVNYKWTQVSKDKTLRAGFVGIYKPSPKPAWPTFVLQVLPYFIDNDRSVINGEIRAPYVAVVAIWAQKVSEGKLIK